MHASCHVNLLLAVSSPIVGVQGVTWGVSVYSCETCVLPKNFGLRPKYSRMGREWGLIMILIDGMGGLVGWTKVQGIKVAVYDADRAICRMESEHGLTWEEAEQVIAAAEAGLAEAVAEGDIGAAPVIVRPGDFDDLAAEADR